MSAAALFGTASLVGLLVALLVVTLGLAYLDHRLDVNREH
jgi:hypothetical protein